MVFYMLSKPHILFHIHAYTLLVLFYYSDSGSEIPQIYIDFIKQSSWNNILLLTVPSKLNLKHYILFIFLFLHVHSVVLIIFISNTLTLDRRGMLMYGAPTIGFSPQGI